MEGQVRHTQLPVPVGLGEVEGSSGRQLHGHSKLLCKLHQRKQSFRAHIVRGEQLPIDQAAYLCAVAQNRQICPDWRGQKGRRKQNKLPPGYRRYGNAPAVRFQEGGCEPGGEGSMVIQEGGAVQVHSNELNVHRKFLFRKWRRGTQPGPE